MMSLSYNLEMASGMLQAFVSTAEDSLLEVGGWQHLAELGQAWGW